MRVKRKFLTLIEMIIVIGILSLVAGVIGVQVNKVLNEQRFRTEVSQVVDQLRLAQDLMLIYDSNVHFKIIPHEDGFVYGITFDNPVPKNWAQELQRPHKKLKYIGFINFHDEKFPENNLKPEGDILFLSGGSVMSRGLLILSSYDDKDTDDPRNLKRFVWLPGYPQPIISVKNRPEIQTESEQGFDSQLSRITRDEILAKQDVKDQEEEKEEQKEKEEETKLEKTSAEKDKKS